MRYHDETPTGPFAGKHTQLSTGVGSQPSAEESAHLPPGNDSTSYAGNGAHPSAAELARTPAEQIIDPFVGTRPANPGDVRAEDALNHRRAGAVPAGVDTTQGLGVEGLPRPKPRKLAIKKIPPELRRAKPAYKNEIVWYRRIIKRLSEDSQYQRSAIQLAFALLCLWIGAEFYLFMQWGTSSGAEVFMPRPPGVEGFLPISALISLKYWWHTGIINNVHPSGLIILLAIVAVSLLLKKAFCSWLCPVGTLSESLWMLGQRLFGRTWDIPRWLDYPLRSLKYLLMAFFVFSVAGMGVDALRMFIYSPYNKMADVKMYLFFADISSAALWTIIILVLLSVVVKNFWCRYLCPYGALLGIAGWLSPLKITRNKETCVDCELCTKACPSRIKVHKAGRVWSDECMSCMACVAVCPVKDTLDVRMSRKSRPVPTPVYGLLVAGAFVAVTGMAMLAGFWQNNISREEYLRRFQSLDAPVYQHFRGEVPAYGPHD